MKREEYLKKLKYLLIDMPAEDLAQIEDFYEELIYDGMEQGYTEEEILSKLETPDEVAKKIRADYGGLVVYTAKSKSQEKKQKGYESSELIHTIRVETENLRIRVKTVDEGPVRIYFKPRGDRDIVDFEEKDGVFAFSHRQKASSLNPLNWLNMLLDFNDFNLLVLEMPVNFAGNLWLKTTNGSVRLSGLGNLAAAEINSNNGKIRLENSMVTSLQTTSGNGKIDLVNLIGETLYASTGNGLITAKECRFEKKLSLQTQNGAVTGHNLISDDIVMQTSNGFVTGTIIGNVNDYNISSTTHNGFNNLDNVYEADRAKSLTARTHNGRIQVEFTL